MSHCYKKGRVNRFFGKANCCEADSRQLHDCSVRRSVVQWPAGYREPCVYSLGAGPSAVLVLSLVNDCYTLLQAVALSIQGDSVDIREIHSIGQMGLNISETDIRNAIAGNQNSIPPFFKWTSKSSSVFTGDSVGTKCCLKGIPTYGCWGKPGSIDGYRYRALNQLDCIAAAIHTDLNFRAQNLELKGFLKVMLTNSQEFVPSIFDYITNSHAKLIKSFTDSDQTWDFVRHIFSHEFNVARSILQGHDLKAEGFKE